MELLGDGIFNADGHLWYEQRKTASKEFRFFFLFPLFFTVKIQKKILIFEFL